MSHLKRVKVLCDQLDVGMFVSDLDREWSETTFLLQGFTIENQQDIDEIKKQCRYVFVDFASEIDYKTFRHKTTKSTTLKKKFETDLPARNLTIREEMGKAKQARNQASTVVKGVLERIMLGEDFEIATVKESVKECVQSILRNEDAMLFMTLIKSKDDYTAEHCLNVGIVSIAFCKFLGFSQEQLENIGLCGMLHDIGKIKIPDAVLNKPGRLTQEEAALMREHARLGYEILLKKPEVPPSVIDVTYTHHERLNGHGYPRGLKDDQISAFSRIIAIVDTFDAITSNRCYEKARSIMDAYKVLMGGRNSHFDEHLVPKFIEWRGIYPPGSIVEMENGEVGIVLSTNPKYKLRPKVMLVLDEHKKARKERIVDLSKLDLDAEAQTYRIIKAVPNKAYGISLQEYVDKGLKIDAV
ncbi:HD-GYP domain-containing protein [Pleionea sp. CnH1-48]|uniref:HD-GYP domain-containing protein n=1 Tax=Pleionea sp. CnH1-48 TaxID=2954494 RepID=UPI002097B30F|nr:HD-GYP domain-containing protein [Pleionea sp. CnH1-48]MCO7227146.1 HD-GYP domain-containing protein [Pleionea sp. CnH1-48]